MLRKIGASNLAAKKGVADNGGSRLFRHKIMVTTIRVIVRILSLAELVIEYG